MTRFHEDICLKESIPATSKRAFISGESFYSSFELELYEFADCLTIIYHCFDFQDGGEDEAEDVFSGLERVASLGWKSRTRVLVHIGDAPCHGAQFHDLHGGELHDRYPGGDAKGRDISSLLQTLRDQCQIIGYLFCHVNDSTKKMISVFKRECDDANWIKEEQLCNIGKLADVMVKVSASSISQSIQVGDSRHVIRKYVTLPVTPTEPLWQNIALERATQIKYKYVQYNLT